jgi:hypothetical protein
MFVFFVMLFCLPRQWHWNAPILQFRAPQNVYKRNPQARKSGGLRPTTVRQFPKSSIFFRDTAGRRAPCNRTPSCSKIICHIWFRDLDRVPIEIFVATYERLEFGLPNTNSVGLYTLHKMYKLKCYQHVMGFQFKTLRICQWSGKNRDQLHI